MTWHEEGNAIVLVDVMVMFMMVMVTMMMVMTVMMMVTQVGRLGKAGW